MYDTTKIDKLYQRYLFPRIGDYTPDYRNLCEALVNDWVEIRAELTKIEAELKIADDRWKAAENKLRRYEQ